MGYNDYGHMPNADWKGMQPTNPVVRGPDELLVELITWGPKTDLFSSMWNQVQATWGDHAYMYNEAEVLSDPVKMDFIESIFRGEKLTQILESIVLHFRIEGVSRACTHQIVRTRGAVIYQHGGRNNDWRHRPFRLPETIRRAIIEVDGQDYSSPDRYRDYDLNHCLTDTAKLKSWCRGKELHHKIMEHLNDGRRLYAVLLDSGIPPQDARRFLPIGMTTFLFANYPYKVLQGFLGVRLEHVMDWEINCVAQLMVREVNMKMPPMFGKYLGSISDKTKKAALKDLMEWPPDQKYPTPYKRKERLYRAEQNPFFVLTDEALKGVGPVEWVPTNGVHPNAMGASGVTD